MPTLRDDLEPLPAVETIGVKVLVESEDRIHVEALSQAHQRRVREVHRGILILRHHLSDGRHVLGLEVGHPRRAGLHPCEERVLRVGYIAEQVHGLGDDRPAREQQGREALEGAHAERVLVISPI
jgi:hypothetical protein